MPQPKHERAYGQEGWVTTLQQLLVIKCFNNRGAKEDLIQVHCCLLPETASKWHPWIMMITNTACWPQDNWWSKVSPHQSVFCLQCITNASSVCSLATTTKKKPSKKCFKRMQWKCQVSSVRTDYSWSKKLNSPKCFTAWSGMQHLFPSLWEFYHPVKLTIFM